MKSATVLAFLGGGGGGNEIIGNWIHHSWVYGIYAYYDDGLLEGNLIEDNDGYGIHLYSQDHPVNGWVIRNNIFRRNGASYRPKYPPYNGNVRPLPGLILTRGKSEFYNNLVYDNPNGGISVWGNAHDTLVANNTVHGNGKYGIAVSNSVSNTRIINNIIWGNSGSPIQDQGVGTVQQNNLTTDPNFVNAAGGDFHLNAGSAAIDAGQNMSEYANDFAYGARPVNATYDIGAYEFGAPPGQSPSPPIPPGSETGTGGTGTGGLPTGGVIIDAKDSLCNPVGAPVKLDITVTGPGDHDNGHGNDDDGTDDSNPGGGSTP